MEAAAGQGVSLKPSDAQPGGGILEALNGSEAVIEKCRFQLWNYNNPQLASALFLGVTYRFDDGEAHEQKYRGGESKYLVPANEGREAAPVDASVPRSGLPEGSNAVIWLTEIVNAGFPEHLIGKDVSVFEGTRVHLAVKPQPKRPGLKNGGEDGKQKDILVVDKILALPGDGQPAAKGKGKAGVAKGKAGVATPTAVAAPVQANAGADAVKARAVEVVMEILAEKGGSIPKVAIAHAAFKLMEAAKDPLRNDVSKLVFKDEFLSADDTPWSYDGTTVSL